jgi:hypothetical protein
MAERGTAPTGEPKYRTLEQVNIECRTAAHRLDIRGLLVPMFDIPVLPFRSVPRPFDILTLSSHDLKKTAPGPPKEGHESE